MSVIIAIDPGASGGIAVLRDTELSVHKMPETPRDICDLIEKAQRDSFGGTFDASTPPAIRCYVERVGGYIGNHGDREDGGGQPGSAMFNFGCGYGIILGILTALKVPFELVTAQQWQKGLSLGTKGLIRPVFLEGMTKDQRSAERKRVSGINNRLKREWKNKLKAVAQQLYPHVKVILDTSDCLLILELARRRENAPRAMMPEAAQKELAV